MDNKEKLKNLSQHQIELLAIKGLEAQEDEKRYSLWHISKNMIEELEDLKDEILEDSCPEDRISEYVDSCISVYTYDQVMIYANNFNDLDLEGADIDDFQGAIVYAIYEYLHTEASAWLYQQQEEVA